MQTLADDPRYKDHPLTAGALRRLGDDYWARQQYDAAVKYWKQVVGQVRRAKTTTEVSIAVEQVVAWYIQTRDYAGYEAWPVNDRESRRRPRPASGSSTTPTTWPGTDSPTDWEKYASASEKEKIEKDKLKAQDMQAFYQYLKASRAWYEKTGDAWRYHDHAMRFLTSLWGDRASREAAINDAVAMVKQIKDKADADAKLARLADLPQEQGQYDRARYVLAHDAGQIQAAYKDAELLVHENKWAAGHGPAARKWKTAATPNLEARAMWERARIYKDATGEYEKAIKLYHEINQPPATLWYIQDAYHRWGKLKESLATLSEIEAMFPEDAPAPPGRRRPTASRRATRKTPSPNRGES